MARIGSYTETTNHVHQERGFEGKGGLMRKLGVAFIGLISGLLVGLLTHEVIARIAMSGSGQLPDSLPLALLLGFLTPALAVVGTVVALVIDGRIRHR